MSARPKTFARPARRRAPRLDCRPAVESFERRELMAAGVFLQGTAFLDSNANGALDLGEAKLAGAAVKLYDAAGATLLASTTTAADGSYKFTDANVAGGLAADTTYRLVESAAGYTNTGAQPLSQVLKATAPATNTIQVTTVDVTKLTTTFTGPVGPPYDRLYFRLGTTNDTIVPTQLNVVLAGDPNVNTAQFPSLCVGIIDRLGFNAPFATLVGTQAELPNGGQIAYLFNHYGTTLPASASTLPANLQAFSTKNLMAGVQVAIWELEYGTSLSITDYDPNYTTAQDYADLKTAAAFFVADAAGKSELSAVLDASLTGTLPASGLAGQSLLATTSLNFGNAPVPLGSLSGFVYVDNNDSGQKLAGDAPIAGVTLTLVRTDGASPLTIGTTTTAADGSYSFPGLAPGTYKVVETQPSAYLDGLDSKNGAILGGSRTTDVIGGIVVGPGGDAPANNFGELVASTLGGNVYLDKNSDGSLDNAEVGIAGVTLKLTGTNDLGTAVSLTTTTGPAGAYSFADLRPGTYVVTETQPAGYTTTGNSVGTVNGVTDGILDRALADVISNIVIPGGVAGINYNFGEIWLVQTTTLKPLVSGDTATIGYWAHSGQALILSLNGGSTSTQLATWLSSNFPGLFPTSLIGTTNQGVANYMKAVFRGQSPKAEAQVLAVALAAYATDSDLAGTTATAYGFNVSASGTAAKTYNVGSNGPSLGLVANGLYSILDLLYAANTVAVNGGLYVNDNGLRSQVTSVFDGINIAGDRI